MKLKLQMEDTNPASGNVDGGEGGGARGEQQDQRRIGGCDVDTRYPRSIEGILRIVTVVSLHYKAVLGEQRESGQHRLYLEVEVMFAKCPLAMSGLEVTPGSCTQLFLIFLSPRT